MSNPSARKVLGTLLAATMTLMAPLQAFADTTVVDGDGITPVATNALSFGNVCANTTVTKKVLIVINRNGSAGSTNVFKDGSTVSLSVFSATGSGLSAGTPSPSTVSIPGNWGTLSNGTDSSVVTSTVQLVAGATPGAFSGSVTYRATGVNSSSATINRDGSVNVSATIVSCDSIPPALNLPPNQTVEATGPSGRVVTFSATATDANPANPTVTCTPASGSTFPINTTTVNCSATDAAGNTASGSFTIKVQDTTPPNVGTPSNITMEATSGGGATVSFSTPSATDLVDGSVSVSCVPSSGSTFALGTTTVTCSATDAHGNSGSSSFTVKIEDTTKPALALPADITAEATSSSGAPVTYSASASDLVDGAITPGCTPASGSTFPLGETTVNCSATDNAGNTATDSFKVKVVDTTAPTLSLPSLSPMEATGPSGAVVNFTPTANDLVDGAVAVTCTPASGSVFALGTTTVNCSATDAAGNEATGSFNVTIADTTPPSLTVPANQVLEATGPGGAVAIFSATATDVVDTSVTVTCDANSGDTFALGTTTVHCTATDDSGNQAQGSFTIEVQDTTAPTVTAPSDVTAEATSSTGAAVTYSGASASDLVDGAITPNCTPASGSTFPLGETTVTCSATDVHGNTGSASFKVKVQDTTAPSVTPPANIVQEATAPTGNNVTYGGASASDLVDGAVAVTCAPASGTLFPIGTTTVTCSATDAAGNTGSATFTIKVQDTLAPNVSCGSASSSWLANNASIPCTASDGGSGLANAGDASFNLVTNVAAGSEDSNASTDSRVVSDQVGNSATAGPISGNKIDRKAPTGITFVGGPAAGGTYYFGSVPAAPTCTATDGGSGLQSCIVSGYNAGIGSWTLTATAKDNVNNTSTATRTYTVMGWTAKGFYQPVDMNGVWNTVKSGSAVPLKFELFAGPTELTSISAVTSIYQGLVTCNVGSEDAVEEIAATGSTVLRYDTTSGQFIFNWKTPGGAAGKCYKVTMTAADGSTLSAFFKLK